MAVGEAFRNLANKRPVGTEVVVYDYITIPGVAGPGSFLYRLTELPLNVPLPNPDNSAVECREVDPFDVELPGPVRLTPIDQSGILTAGKFVIKLGTTDADDTFKFGQIRFSQFDAGRRFKVIYTGRGSLVYAEDVLNLNYGLSLLPNVIRPGHISNVVTDDFTFPRNVDISGNLNIAGVVNRSISEIVSITDDELLMNSDSVTPGPDVSFTVHRGSSGDPSLTWGEGDDSWSLIGTSSNALVKAFDTGSPRFEVFGDLLATGNVSASGFFVPPSYTTLQEPAITIVANIPGVFYNSDEKQAKMIVPDGLGGAKLVIVG